jgi:hypothetical protein
MNIPDHISESSQKQFFGLQILKFFDADPDPGSGIFLTLDPVSGMEKKNSDPGSGINIPDPQPCWKVNLRFKDNCLNDMISSSENVWCTVLQF